MSRSRLLASVVVVSLGAAVAVPARAAARFPLPVYESCSSVAGKVAADFDGDGRLDVMVSCWYGGVQFLRGDGSGNLAASLYGGGSTVRRPKELISADFNEDGIPDVAVRFAELNDGGVAILVGNGTGALSETTRVTGSTAEVAPIAAGDLDGDGHVDLVTADSFVRAHFGRGDGSFERSAYLFALPFQAHRLTAADLDGNGFLDLVVTGTGGAAVAVVTRGVGGGLFEAPVSHPVGANPHGHLVVDLDGDSRPEILVANRDSSDLSILRNRGDGTYHPETRAAVAGSPRGLALLHRGRSDPPDVFVWDATTPRLSALPIGRNGELGPPRAAFPARMFIYDPLLADLEGRGADSLIWHDGSVGMTTTPLRADGVFQGPIGIPVGQYISRLTAGDVDGDGHLDLVGITTRIDPSEILVWRGDGNGAFAAPIRTVLPYYFWTLQSVVHDLDRDGDGDLVLRGTSFFRSLVVLRGNGDSTFTPVFEDWRPLFPGNVLVEDRDGDGLGDLVAGTDNGLQWYRGIGACEFELGSEIPLPREVTWFDTVDFNGDGFLDLVAAGNSGTFAYKGRVDGSLDPQPIGITARSGEVLSVDFDRDGREEIVVGDGFMLRYDDTYGFQFVNSWYRTMAARFADVDGDGLVDVCGTEIDSRTGEPVGAFFAWVPEDSTFQSVYLTGYDGLGRVVAVVGDFVEDGRPDVVIQPNHPIQEILVYPNIGAAPNRPPLAVAGPDQLLECSEAGGADATLDGSGSTDEDGDALSCSWSAGSVTLDTPDACEASGMFPLGTTEATLVVSDGATAVSDTVTISVVDTTAPRGTITSPTTGACFGRNAVPVPVVDDFVDVCDPAFERTYSPDGPAVDGHGDHQVTLTATDGSRNAASSFVDFTIDLVAPVVSISSPTGSTWISGSTAPFSVVFQSSDDDGAAGEVLRETVTLAGCTAYDGDSYGDRDGLLSDESIVLGVAEVCRIATACGWSVLEQPELRVEARDCGGNVGSAAVTFRGRVSLRPGICGR